MRISNSLWPCLALLGIALAGWGCGDTAAGAGGSAGGSGGTAGTGGTAGGSGGTGGAAGMACTGCDSNATCEASGCVCNEGFSGDGETCHEIWTLLGTLPATNGDPEGVGTVSVAAGSRLFFAPLANDPDLRFMRSFDVSTLLFSDPLALPPPVTGQSDFCWCGFTQTFVSNGVWLYLLGNRGERYDPVANSWTSVPSYTAVRRGEAASAFDAISNVFLLIGGRGTESSAIRMALGTEVFSAELGTFPTPVDSAKAHTMPGALTTFVAGGDENNGVALLSHSTGTDVWTRLADAPEGLGRLVAVGDYDDKLWAARRDGMFFFYDPATDTWDSDPVAAPAGFLSAENVAGGTYAVVQNGSDIDVYRLSSGPDS